MTNQPWPRPEHSTRLGALPPYGAGSPTVMNSIDQMLLNLINRRLGIVVKANQFVDLRRIVNDACQSHRLTRQAYLERLTGATIDAPIMKDLVAGITIGETYFFRDHKQMELIQKVILPNLIARKRNNQDFTLRFWSAGCASGEEIYTLIMQVNELLTDKERWHCHFLGTDINANVLQKALQGEYSEWSMRSINAYFKQKYLTPSANGQRYSLDKTIIAKAQFGYLNLNDNTYPALINGTQAVDLILCRNVLIYFDNAHIQQIMRKFSACLAPEGFLLLGASDPVLAQDTELQLQPEHGKLLLRPLTPTARSATLAPPPRTFAPALAAPTITPPPAINTIARTSPAAAPTRRELFAAYQQQGQWQRILDEIAHLPLAEQQNPHYQSLQANALANCGKLPEALLCCEAILRQEGINLLIHFTMAMILLALEDVTAAEAALRKTLFLEREFVMGHYQLGLLLLRTNRRALGLKSLQNACAITQNHAAAKSVPGYENLNLWKISGNFGRRD